MPMDIIKYEPQARNIAENPTDAFHRDNTKWRNGAYKWLGQELTLASVMVFRRVHEGHRRLLSAHLKMSGIKWDRRQLWDAMTKLRHGDYVWTEDSFRVAAAQSSRHSR
eukprot:7376473-Pyramimonas_sp.AAC.1